MCSTKAFPSAVTTYTSEGQASFDTCLTQSREDHREFVEGCTLFQARKMHRGLFHLAYGPYDKSDGSVKLALNWKLINRHIYRNRDEVPNMNELVDNVALAIRGDTKEPIWISNIDLKYAYSQMQLNEKKSRQCIVCIIG